MPRADEDIYQLQVTQRFAITALCTPSADISTNHAAKIASMR